MISGQVQAHHALLNAAVRLPGQPDVTLEFAVDTGFYRLPDTAAGGSSGHESAVPSSHNS